MSMSKSSVLCSILCLTMVDVNGSNRKPFIERISDLAGEFMSKNSINKALEEEQFRHRLLSNNPASLSTADKQAILDEHNSLRSKIALGQTDYGFPSASNMNQLTWDPASAAFASQYTGQCVGGHSGSQYMAPFSNIVTFEWPNYPNNIDGDWNIGENLFFSSVTSVDSQVTLSNVNMWYNEAQYWSFGEFMSNNPSESDSCTDSNGNSKVCGHMTQIAWAQTRYVGCGFSICSTMTPTRYQNYHYYFSCNYYPAGNYIDRMVYESGTPCTQCDADREYCENGLCAGGVSKSFNSDGRSAVTDCDNGLGVNLCLNGEPVMNTPAPITPNVETPNPTPPPVSDSGSCSDFNGLCDVDSDCCSNNCRRGRCRN
eukprot:256666_1